MSLQHWQGKGRSGMFRACFICVATASFMFGSPIAAKTPDTWDGLYKVKAKRLDAAYLQPGADFRPYTKVIIDPVEIAMRKNWQRDVNRQSHIRVSDSDLKKAIELAGSLFDNRLRNAYEKAGYQVVSDAGPDVLRIATAIINVDVYAPESNTAAISRTYSAEAGEATLAIEVRDSLTGSLMGRAIDERTAGDWGPYLRNRLTNRADFERLFTSWAKISADSLGVLKASSPIDTNARLIR